MAERGGFSLGEMDSLFPDWRKREDAFEILSAENATLKAEIANWELAFPRGGWFAAKNWADELCARHNNNMVGKMKADTENAALKLSLAESRGQNKNWESAFGVKSLQEAISKFKNALATTPTPSEKAGELCGVCHGAGSVAESPDDYAGSLPCPKCAGGKP